MPNWKKVITSGSDAQLNSLYSSGPITGSDVKINDWGSISASLASLDASVYGDSDVTDHINSLNVHSGSHLGTADTDDLSEGSTNLYYTDTRVKTKLNTEGVISGSSQVVISDTTGYTSFSSSIASDIAGLNNAGYVDTNGTPADNQIAVFTDSNTIEGNSKLTYNNSTGYLSLTSGSILVEGQGWGTPGITISNGATTGTSNDNAILQFRTSGPNYWTMGIDRNDDNTFKISNSSALSSGTILTLDDSGAVPTIRIGSLVVSGSGTFKNIGPAQFSGSIGIRTSDQVQASTDTDKFLVLDGEQIKYRSGAQLLSDINPSGLISGSEQVEDIVGGMLTGNTETNITVTYQDSDGTIDFDVDDATTSQKGVIEIATNSEVTTGTDTSRAITPSSLTSITKLGTITTGNVDAILPSGVVSGSVSSPSQGTLSVNGNNIDLGLQTGDSPTFNDLLVTGNLTVEGSRTELQVSELNVEDINITIASGAVNSAAADGAGITIAGANESLTWNHANSRFQFSDDLRVDGLLNIGSVSNAGTDTDKFLVLDSNGNVDYRTGAQVLSDIGGVGSSNGITGEGSFGSVGYSGNGVDYYSLARFSGSTSNVTGSDEIEFFVNDSSLISGPVRKGITFGRSTGERTYFDETGFVVSQLNNTNGLPQDSVNVNLQEDGSGDPIFVIQTGNSAGLTLGTGDSPRFFMSGSVSNGSGGTRVGIGGFSGDSTPFESSLDNIQDTLHIKGGLTVEKPTSSGTSAGVNLATNVRITGSLIVSASNTFINQGPAEFSGSVKVNTSDQVQASTDTDKFLVLDGDQIKYRSGAQVRSDIGAASSGITLQSVTDNGSSTTNSIVMANFTVSNPTNNNAGSDKILVLDGANRSKIRTRDELRSDIGALQASKTPQMVVTAAEVLDEATTNVYIPFSGINIFPETNTTAYSRFHAPYDGYIKEIIVHPHEAGTSGNCIITPTIGGTATTAITESISATAGTPTTFSFGVSGYSFSDGDDIYLAFDRVANDRSKGFSFTIVFIMDATS